MKLSILIPGLIGREDSRASLVSKLRKQARELGVFKEVQIIVNIDDGSKTIGAKRNELLEAARGKYLCFIDDDDEVSQTYLEDVFEGINYGADCCSLRGVITWDGIDPEVFEHSIKYGAYATTTNPIKYERYPNHLNVIKSEIAKQFKFPETDHGEDTNWATQIHESGLIKMEHYIDRVMYHYQYKTNK